MAEDRDKRPATMGALMSASRTLLAVVQEWVTPAFSATTKKIDALERRIAELEKQPQMRYRGVWQAAEQYRRGDFVTMHGSMWACAELAQGERPGASPAWTLAVKHGARPR